MNKNEAVAEVLNESEFAHYTFATVHTQSIINRLAEEVMMMRTATNTPQTLMEQQ